MRNVYYLAEDGMKLADVDGTPVELATLRIAGRDGKGSRVIKK